MTPPQKKPAPKGVSGAKKSPAGKAVPKKKRGRAKRGKAGSFLPPVVAAFLAGLLMAFFCFWGIYHIVNKDQGKPASTVVEPAAARSRKTLESPKTVERAAAQAEKAAAVKKTEEARPAPSVLPPVNVASKAEKAEAERPPLTAGEPGASAAQKGERDGEGRLPPGLSSGQQSAVASALIDLQALPYEESLSAPLDERIRQVDYALIQAAWLSRLSASNMRLVNVQDRLHGVEPYHFQVIDILPGPSAKAYMDALRGSLKAWAEKSSLRPQGNNEWSITLGEVQTHSLRLYPGKSAFPDAGKAPPPPNYPRRLRKEGDSAKMVIVIDDLGEGMGPIRRLLQLSYPVTCAFWPHSAHVEEGADAAHRAGREIIIHQPMEPVGYPKVKPGPGVLLSTMSADQIAFLVGASIAKVPHAVGLNNHMGSRFTQSRAGVDAVIAVLRRHGLFMLDSVTHAKSVFAAEGKRQGIETHRRNVFLDVAATKAGILAELRRAERIALLTGQSVAIGHPLPETLDALEAWQSLRDPSVQLVRLRDISPE